MIRLMDSEHLNEFLNEYNWDDGFNTPIEIISNNNCDIATALKIFYLADGYSYLCEKTEYKGKWYSFVSSLFQRIINNEFPKGNTAFTIPLTKVQIYKLRKIGIPEVFLSDIN